MKKVIIVAILALIVIPTTYVLGFQAGLSSPPSPNKGVYNITINEDTGVVNITTKVQYVQQSIKEDRLVIYGEATFEEVK